MNAILITKNPGEDKIFIRENNGKIISRTKKTITKKKFHSENNFFEYIRIILNIDNDYPIVIDPIAMEAIESWL